MRPDVHHRHRGPRVWRVGLDRTGETPQTGWSVGFSTVPRARPGRSRPFWRVMHDVEPQLVALLNAIEPPFTLRDAAAHGISRWVLDRLVRQGRVERLGRGLYAAPHPPPPEQDEARWQRIHRLHRARAQQAVARHPTHVLSHQTAALAYGWPVGLATLREVQPDRDRAVATEPPRGGTGPAPQRHGRQRGGPSERPAAHVAGKDRGGLPAHAVAAAGGGGCRRRPSRRRHDPRGSP